MEKEKESILLLVQDVLIGQFPCLTRRMITPNASILRDLGLDDDEVLMFHLACEVKFDIKLPFEKHVLDPGEKDLDIIENLVDYIQKHS